MKKHQRIFFSLVFTILLMMAMCLFAFKLQAQADPEPEATPFVTDDGSTVITPVGGDVNVDGDDTVINTEVPSALAPIAALGVTAFGILQFLKDAFLSDWVKTHFKEDKKQEFVYLIVGAFLALGIILLTESQLDALTYLGFSVPTKPIPMFVRYYIVTPIIAAAIQMGLHIGYDAVWSKKK